jgi:polyadenylate-binding protein
MVPRGRVYRYPPGPVRNMPEGQPMPGVGVGGMIQPYDMGSFPVRDAGLSPAAPMGTLTSNLANATPDQQRTVCLGVIHFHPNKFANGHSDL